MKKTRKIERKQEAGAGKPVRPRKDPQQDAVYGDDGLSAADDADWDGEDGELSEPFGLQGPVEMLDSFWEGVDEADEPEEPEEPLLTAAELTERLLRIFDDYHLIGVKRDRRSFLALTEEDLKAYPHCIYGLFLTYVLGGELDKAEQVYRMLDEHHMFRLGMELCDPRITLRRFVDILDYLKEQNTPIHSLIITAGRPSVLNGLIDFTRIAPYLEIQRNRIIGYMKYIYEESLCAPIYNLTLAEWYYQQNRLIDAGTLVSRTLTFFDDVSQRRLLFTALYLQSKIAIANGTGGLAVNYVQNIRNYVHKEGEQEFSFNIDAAEVMAALYDGDHAKVQTWLHECAPDEFTDFNMLDLYRYMVKIRCYIVTKKYTTVIALAERLRPPAYRGKALDGPVRA